jgi:hypothetical protein
VPTLISAIDQITPEWLTALLHSQQLLPNRNDHVLQIEVKPAHTPISALAYLTVTYSKDVPKTLPSRFFLKYTNRESVLNLVDMGRAEIEFYARFPKLMPNPPVVACFSAEYDTNNGHFQLLLEDVSVNYLSYPASQLAPTLRETEQILEALARWHAFWWGHPLLNTNLANFSVEVELNELTTQATSLFKNWAAFMSDRLSPERNELIQKNYHIIEQLLSKRLAKLDHLTIAHKDPHIGNFLYPRQHLESSALIIDWDTWGIDFGVSDLVGFMAMFWFPERRLRYEKTLLKRYYERIVELGVRGYSWEDCLYDYRLALSKTIYRPLSQWARGVPTDIWWNHFERLILAYQDWDCTNLGS